MSYPTALAPWVAQSSVMDPRMLFALQSQFFPQSMSPWDMTPWQSQFGCSSPGGVDLDSIQHVIGIYRQGQLDLHDMLAQPPTQGGGMGPGGLGLIHHMGGMGGFGGGFGGGGRQSMLGSRYRRPGLSRRLCGSYGCSLHRPCWNCCCRMI